MKKKLTAYKSGDAWNELISKDSYLARVLRLKNDDDRQLFDHISQHVKELVVFDKIERQLRELIRIENIQLSGDDQRLETLMAEKLKNIPLHEYGVWVYYPWSQRLVHLLDEEEFIKVRTSRNIYKINPQEIELLRTKKIGIIGLSVGQTIAQTLALERICGSLHLADFDTLDLSNMNRLNVGVHEIGLSKAVIAARKIAELDPFIKVSCFGEGLHQANMEDFFLKDGKLDILVEECDGIEIKILSRLKARELKVPVIMDTNDRGMLDIERFDLEPLRPLFHGRLDENVNLEELNNLSNQEKLPLLDAMIDLNSVSEKMKFSLNEIGKTISTWPQLASSVMLGGAIVADTCRRVLLKETNQSGRYFIDLEKLIK